jgi:hypothetical protein
MHPLNMIHHRIENSPMIFTDKDEKYLGDVHPSSDSVTSI